MSGDCELEWIGLRVKSGKKQILIKDSGIIRPGTMNALLGPSGSGKSTLLNALTGRSLIPIRGRIVYHGKSFKKGSSWPVQIGYVGQFFEAYGYQTVSETLDFVCNMRGVDLKEAEFLIEILGLQKCRNTLISKVSGGELKRVSIAVELIGSPKMIFLDEPTSGLDSANARNLLVYLQKLTTRGASVLMTIHQPSPQIIQMFQTISLMTHGTCVYQGTLENSLKYFKELGYENLQGKSMCDFLLDLLVANPLIEDIYEAEERIKKLKIAWESYNKSQHLHLCDTQVTEIGAINSKNESDYVGGPKSMREKSSNNALLDGISLEEKRIFGDSESVQNSGLSDTKNLHENSLSGKDTPRKTSRNPIQNYFFKFFCVFYRNLQEILQGKKSLLYETIFKVLVIAATFYYRDNQFLPSTISTLLPLYSLLGCTANLLGCFPSEKPIILRERRSGLYDGYTAYFAKLSAYALYRILMNAIFLAMTLLATQSFSGFLTYVVFLSTYASAIVFSITLCLTIGTLFKNTRASQGFGILLMWIFIYYGYHLTQSGSSTALSSQILRSIFGVFEDLFDFIQYLSYLMSLRLRTQSIHYPLQFPYCLNISFIFEQEPLILETFWSGLVRLWVQILVHVIIGSLYLHFSTKQSMNIKPDKK